jgi:hypothetical protein
VPRPGGKPGRDFTWSPWNCERDCRPDGTWNDEERSRRGCTRVDLPEVPWAVDVAKIVRVGSWTGRPREPGVTEMHGVRCPKDGAWEDPADGCPAGWRRSIYLASLRPYLRTRTQTGDRVPNPLLDRCDDPAIWQAVLALEDEEERCIAHIMRCEAHARDQQQQKTADP